MVVCGRQWLPAVSHRLSTGLGTHGAPYMSHRPTTFCPLVVLDSRLVSYEPEASHRLSTFCVILQKGLDRTQMCSRSHIPVVLDLVTPARSTTPTIIGMSSIDKSESARKRRLHKGIHGKVIELQVRKSNRCTQKPDMLNISNNYGKQYTLYAQAL